MHTKRAHTSTILLLMEGISLFRAAKGALLFFSLAGRYIMYVYDLQALTRPLAQSVRMNLLTFNCIINIILGFMSMGELHLMTTSTCKPPGHF